MICFWICNVARDPGLVYQGKSTVYIRYNIEHPKSPAQLSDIGFLLDRLPPKVNMNDPILRVDQMIFVVDPSVVNNIAKIDLDMSQRFLRHPQEAMVRRRRMPITIRWKMRTKILPWTES